MDSSSGEESFTWEKASYGSDASDEPSKLEVQDVNNTKTELKDRKKRKHNIEENSFQEEECPKRKKIKTEPESDSEAKKKIKKKMKLSNSNGYSYNLSDSEQQENDEYLNMQVKQEQKCLELSNSIKYEKNKKHRDSEFENVDSKDSNVNDNTSKKKKNKKKKELTNNELSIDSATENDLCNHENQDDNIVQEKYELSKKSPKKKKRKERLPSESHDSPENENKLSAEETKVQNNKSSDYNFNESNQSDHSNDLDSSMGVNDTKYSKKQHQNSINIHSTVRITQSQNDSPRKITSTKQIDSSHNNVAAIDDKSNSAYYNDEEIRSHSNNVLDDSTYKNHSESLKKQFFNTTNNQSPIKIANNSPKTLSSKQRMDSLNNVSITKPGRLMDRICYEDDPDTDTDVTQSNNDTSTYLKKYLKQNNNLQPIVKGLKKGSEITDDDELWILKCPHDIDIQKLDNTCFNLDNKSKIKIHGETYCGNLDENTSTIAILSSDNCNFIIKNVVTSGTINLRKRLPKPHVQEDNVMVNNQTDFIPLPKTKCRHPLFGSDYKDAIHVRMRERVDSAAEDPEVSTIYERKKKKKHHKRDYYTTLKQELDNSFETSPKLENEADVTIKKAKKRKHVTEDESYKKKPKRIKLEPDSAEAWESEKAIEENLFNF
ncbi:asparagine-rich protein-like [Ostrinia furnacalis]|uniref:asparagine-rich protein-like n=1 Tax=Ostrinia furnacalis TaxID=93504 RepID=UPI001039709A|nr:asparagine-rich protein-like [Ostrinia furnacalis]